MPDVAEERENTPMISIPEPVSGSAGSDDGSWIEDFSEQVPPPPIASGVKTAPTQVPWMTPYSPRLYAEHSSRQSAKDSEPKSRKLVPGENVYLHLTVYKSPNGDRKVLPSACGHFASDVVAVDELMGAESVVTFDKLVVTKNVLTVDKLEGAERVFDARRVEVGAVIVGGAVLGSEEVRENVPRSSKPASVPGSPGSEDSSSIDDFREHVPLPPLPFGLGVKTAPTHVPCVGPYAPRLYAEQSSKHSAKDCAPISLKLVPGVNVNVHFTVYKSPDGDVKVFPSA